MANKKQHSRKQMQAAAELARLTAFRRVAEAQADAALLTTLAEQIEQLLDFVDRSAKSALSASRAERIRELSGVLEIPDLGELQVTDSSIVLDEPVG